MNILLVEDDGYLGRQTRNLLKEELDLEVDWVVSLKEAYESIDKKEYAFYICDGRFPEERGMADEVNCFNLHDKIMENYGEVDMLIWSHSHNLKSEARERGLDFLNEKFISFEEDKKKFFSAVEKYMENYENRERLVEKQERVTIKGD